MWKNASWYKRCLPAILMIMINGLVLIHHCAAKEVGQIYESPISTQIVLRHQNHSPDLKNYTRYLISENGKTKTMKSRRCRLMNTELIMIKLKNVIDRYFIKKSELRALFSGVIYIESKKFEKFKDLLPKHKPFENFTCAKLKHIRTLKKQTYGFLSKFHHEVQSFEENFQELINYEKLPRFKIEDRSKGKRLKILKELQNDLKTLDVEIVDVLAMRKNKRLNFARKFKSLTIIPPPTSQTDLMIKEWEIIQYSKVFLKSWKKKLQKMCNCWKKKRN